MSLLLSGTFRAEVQGPSEHHVDVDINTLTIGKATVEFVPQEEGNGWIKVTTTKPFSEINLVYIVESFLEFPEFSETFGFSLTLKSILQNKLLIILQRSHLENQ